MAESATVIVWSTGASAERGRASIATVNLSPRRIRWLQVGASNSPGTAVVALFSPPSTSSHGAADGRRREK